MKCTWYKLSILNYTMFCYFTIFKDSLILTATLNEFHIIIDLSNTGFLTVCSIVAKSMSLCDALPFKINIKMNFSLTG